MPNLLALTLQASGPQTTSGASAAFDLALLSWATDGLTRQAATLRLEVTAASGTTPTLNVTIETSPNTTSWKQVLVYDQLGAVGYQRLATASLERYVRAKWTIAGTLPSFTLLVAGDAETIYATPTDFYAFGIPAIAVGVTDPVDLLARCLLAASSEANAKIPREYALPIKYPYPDSLKMRVSEIAAYKFISQRGFDPDDPADKELKTNSDAARKWLDDLGKGTVPDWIDATPDVFDGGAAVVSRPIRGW